MFSTDNYEIDLVVPKLAVGYHKEFPGNGVRFHKNTFVGFVRGGPFGGGCSTAGDLLRFASALRGDRLVGSGYRKMLLSAKPGLGSPDYGYGFEVDRESGWVGHGGRFPGVSTFLSMFPESGYTAVILSNYSDTSPLVNKKIRSLFSRVSQTHQPQGHGKGAGLVTGSTAKRRFPTPGSRGALRIPGHNKRGYLSSVEVRRGGRAA
jgi:CubicO group peptidase (beta-lactamase class C family)